MHLLLFISCLVGVIQNYFLQLPYIIPGCMCMKLYKTNLSTLLSTSLVVLLLSPLSEVFILLPAPRDDLTCWLKNKKGMCKFNYKSIYLKMV